MKHTYNNIALQRAVDALENLSVASMTVLQQVLIEKIGFQTRKNREIGLTEIEEIAKGVGMTALEVYHFKLPAEKKIYPPKYKHPVTGETWSGRGKKPGWIKEWVENKRQMFELEIGLNQ